MAQKGMILYFDIRPALNHLSNEQKGQLLDAMFDYAEFGTIPDFNSSILAMAWDFIKPRLDADTERYNLKCLSNKYAAFVREEKKKGIDERDIISREEWLNQQAISSDII